MKPPPIGSEVLLKTIGITFVCFATAAKPEHRGRVAYPLLWRSPEGVSSCRSTRLLMSRQLVTNDNYLVSLVSSSSDVELGSIWEAWCSIWSGVLPSMKRVPSG
jgi:hypothetical protein